MRDRLNDPALRDGAGCCRGRPWPHSFAQQRRNRPRGDAVKSQRSPALAHEPPSWHSAASSQLMNGPCVPQNIHEWCARVDASSKQPKTASYCRNANRRKYESLMSKLTVRRDGPGSWMLSDAATGRALGGITYVHADGNHYRAWRNVGGERHDVGEAVPQLGMAVQAVTDAIARSGKP